MGHVSSRERQSDINNHLFFKYRRWLRCIRLLLFLPSGLQLALPTCGMASLSLSVPFSIIRAAFCWEARSRRRRRRSSQFGDLFGGPQRLRAASWGKRDYVLSLMRFFVSLSQPRSEMPLFSPVGLVSLESKLIANQCFGSRICANNHNIL